MNIPSNTLRDAKRLFGRLKHLRCKLPALQHLMLTAGQNGMQLAATDLDHWLENQISDQPTESTCFLIPPTAMDAACRADKGSNVTTVACGGKRSREIRLTIQCGGITATSAYPTLDPSELPSRPVTIGTVTELPTATMEGLASVAGCTSTDGKRLACCPATVPTQSFVLPLAACHILGHPDFTAGPAAVTWIDHKDPEKRHVAIHCGRHQLVSKPLIGNYPNYKQVIPAFADQLAVIPHDRKPGVIAWLRPHGKDQTSVRLDWHKRGQLTLTHRDANGHSSTMQVPVEIHGSPPVIAFNARYLADALKIGGTLCLSDELSPGICRHPSGRFAVVMPKRLDITGSPDVETADPREPQAHPAKAAA